MTMKSMTGFARTTGASEGLSWAWEIKSVNGRIIDLRFRLAPGFESLEAAARELAQRHLQRGSVAVNLTVDRAAGAAEVRLNPVVLERVVAAADEVRRRTGGVAPSVGELLSLRGVLDYVEAVESEAVAETRARQMLGSFDAAVRSLIDVRASEGARLGAILASSLDAISGLCAVIAASPSRSVEVIAARLSEQVSRLLAQTGGALDPGRLHQEAALLATRGDIEEELQRLGAHVAAARELLAAHSAVGRKLDFLCQEFNREANTLCSKSNDVAITRAGLEIKALIDQMREQIQNIE